MRVFRKDIIQFNFNFNILLGGTPKQIVKVHIKPYSVKSRIKF